jgi:hypothetical protein
MSGGPEFDRVPGGLVRAAVIVIAGVAALMGGGVCLGWMMWGAA